jgi:DNA polymerase III epsilon subunit-like protein
MKVFETLFKNIVVVDLETSGVSPFKHGVLSIGAVMLSDLTKTFYSECRLNKEKLYSFEALKINGFTTEEIFDPEKLEDYQIRDGFIKWCNGNGLTMIAAHNPILERFFLEDIPGNIEKWPFSHRTLDLHSIYFTNSLESKSMNEICKALSVPEEPKPHNGLQGALAEARCLRKIWGLD